MSSPQQELHELWRPMLLATLAGLSTTIGAVLAVVHPPDERHMAVLLGFAIGVMATVSIVELIVRNALEHDMFMVLGATILGGMGYYMVEPFLPKVDLPHEHKFNKEAELKEDDIEGRGSTLIQRRNGQLGKVLTPTTHRDSQAPQRDVATPAAQELQEATAIVNGSHAPGLVASGHDPVAAASRLALSKSHMMRLGLLMAITMTLHNLPEGFAVAFTAFTPLGPVMALAIAMHNIPEGIIIAAPLFAATGNRVKAIAMATASGLSEPLGALVSMLLLRPFLDAERLQYVLAGTGGLMLAVCAIELWPEARSCKNDRGLALGIILGLIAMLFTLVAESLHAAHMSAGSL